MAQIRLVDEASIENVVTQMTLLEKAKLCGGALPFETHPVERLGIPKLVMADGHNGINIFHLLGNYVARAVEQTGKEPSAARGLVDAIRSAGKPALQGIIDAAWHSSPVDRLMPKYGDVLKALSQELKREIPKAGLPTCFPPGIVIGATWDLDLAAEYGRAVAKEARAFGMDIMLGPNVNIHRDPLCGRMFESYSEDPYLAGKIAVSYIRGLQEEGVAGVVKHFVANNQEHDRLGGEQKISERALREIYFPAFKAAVQEGESWMVMSAYNRVNGEACALSKRLLTDVLRTQWGFHGFVVSDWAAVYDRVAALQAGNDLEMPGPLDPQQIVRAVRTGELHVTVLDERVASILRIMLKLPAFKGARRPDLDREYSKRIARRMAAEGMVLLKNENDALPFSGRSIAVFGQNAREPIATGTGSAGVVSPPVVSTAEGLTSRFGDDRIACDAIMEETDLAIICAGVNSGEGSDRENLQLAAGDVELIRDVAGQCRRKGIKSAVILNVCGPVEMTDWIGEVDAVLLIWLAGMELGHAVADVVSGDVCPSGKLPMTFPKQYRDTPTFLNFPGEFAETVYGEDIFVGYRYYDTAEVEPLFEFGYGLSYSSFRLDNLKLSVDTLDIETDRKIRVSIDAANTGTRSGKEVVQLYIHDVRTSVRKAEKELKGFAKVSLEPGQKKTVVFDIGTDTISHFDTRMGRWCVEPGRFQILVGTSSRRIHARAEFRAVGPNPYAYGLTTPISTIMRDERARAVLRAHLPEEAIESVRLREMVACLPFAAFERAWSRHFAGFLAHLSEREIEHTLDRVCTELSRIDLD